MDSKKELGIKMLLVTLFTTSFMFTGLWMAGYLENEKVSYTRYQNLIQEQLDSKREEHHNTKNQQNEIEEYQLNYDLLSPTSKFERRLEAEQKDILDSTLNNKEQYKPSEVKKPTPKISSVEVTTEEKPLDIAYDLQHLESQMDLSQFPSINVLATGYTAGIESTGKHPDHPEYGITYSGVKVRRDLYSTIAADPKVFPIGTILYIPGYGYGVVADTGGAIKGNKIDLYFEQVEDVYELWGKQHVNVYLVQKGDGEVTEAMLDHLNQDESVLVYKSNQ